MRPDDLPHGPRRDAVAAVLQEIEIQHELINMALEDGDYATVWAARQWQKECQAELQRRMTCHWHELGESVCRS
jgi:hypothetical protein